MKEFIAAYLVKCRMIVREKNDYRQPKHEDVWHQTRTIYENNLDLTNIG